MRKKADQQDILKDMRVERGLSLEQLAEATGISKSALAAYESDDDREIGSYNLAILAKYFGVSADYILGLSLHSYNHGDELEDLGLTSEAIEVLQSGRYNPRLLSEILCNEKFLRFMVDAEIYVDGAASTQFHTQNRIMDATRLDIIKKAHPDEYKLIYNKIKEIEIDEEGFFEHALAEDLMSIMRDIREAHRDDPDTINSIPEVDRIVSNLEDAVFMEGTPEEKQQFFSEQLLGIAAADTQDGQNEQENLIRALFTSGFLKPAEQGRKKKRSRKNKNTD